MLARQPRHQVRQNSYGGGEGDPMAPAAPAQPTVIIGAPGPVMQQAQDAGMPLPGSPGVQQSSTSPGPTGPDAHPMDPGGSGEGTGPAPMHPTDPIAPATPPAPTHIAATGDDAYEPDPYSPYPQGGDYQDVYGMKHRGGFRRPPRRSPGIKPILPPAQPLRHRPAR